MGPVKETSGKYRHSSLHLSQLIRRNKAVCMVTSTPVKLNREQHSKLEWPFSVEESPNLSLDRRSLIKCVANSALQCKNTKEGNNLDTLPAAPTGSTDKTCFVNRTTEGNSDKKNSAPSKVDFDPRNEVGKWRIMNSDEENEYQSNIKNSVTNSKYIKNRITASSTDVQCSTRKEKPQKVNYSINSRESLPIYEARVDDELDATSEIFPTSISKPSNNVLLIEKPLDNVEVLQTKSIYRKITPSKALKDRKNTSDRNNDTPAARRSSRKRCKPLEYWNGERFKTTRDDSPEIVPNVDYINAKGKKMKKVRDAETELKNVQQSNEVSISIPSTGISHKAETEIASESSIEERNENRVIFKSKSRIKSKKEVRFSGTTAETGSPVLKENSKSDWHVNFHGIKRMPKVLLNFDNFSILPGLNTVMGIVSSSIMQMPPNGMNRSQAPDHHHMVFCIMAGNVVVTIHETSIKMDTYGHFTVPCGISYTLENISEQQAILSCFEIANGRYK
ncbi:centromere protein C-like isoform X2 [Diprion similis]|nr:centromere protein C-like isoform X2 [Diprion similis]